MQHPTAVGADDAYAAVHASRRASPYQYGSLVIDQLCCGVESPAVSSVS